MLRINDSVSVGGQPGESELQSIQEEGFRTIVNFREEGEADDQLPPSDEGEQARALGMRYLHLPTMSHTLTPEVIDRFRAAFDNLPRPIYAHCATGKRAAAVVLAQIACQRRMSKEEIEATGRQYDLRDRRDLIKAVASYVSRRCGE